ncbi:MAG: ATP-binding cassette domain-containing protein, partial [Balneolales bacterium]|nr:ATP-binding cassette domain-containing protein [Balneolales bacterium]
MIESRNISIALPGGKKIVDDVSIQIKPGVLTAVIGKNGAGKSSALKAICGDAPITSGSVFVEGKNLLKQPLGELAKKRAVVTQKVSLDFSFSTLEVVSIGRSPYSGVFNSAHDDEIIHWCLEKVDALHLADQSYTTLSGGEQQRVHFARALA